FLGCFCPSPFLMPLQGMGFRLSLAIALLRFEPEHNLVVDSNKMNLKERWNIKTGLVSWEIREVHTKWIR
ncbi:hypothetical protein, partial [Xylanibacillus composti]|uniref:hypothetical protein n=1 Tax=Xylanibacillus composti TaxID=1572762 RepID=UPI001BCD03AE